MLIDLQMKHPCLAPEEWRKGLGLKDFHPSELSSMAARLQSSPTIPSHIDPPEISRKKRAGLKLGFSVAVSQPGVALLQQCPFAAWRCRSVLRHWVWLPQTQHVLGQVAVPGAALQIAFNFISS